MELYNKYSDYLKNKYGEKVYKLPVNLPATCPNRDGSISFDGCIFCGEEGAGFETLSNELDIKTQLETNMKFIEENYHAKKFIAYFQNFSNTYLPFNQFSNYINQSLIENVVAIYISTRPDCITDEQLDFLKKIKESQNIDVVLELGLQTVNYNTLKILNRGHTLAEFIYTVNRIKSKNLEVCVHCIIDLPWDTIDDTVEGAKILSALNVDQVKIHSLYILKDTLLGNLMENGEISPINFKEYIKRTIFFLEYLSPKIVIQRLIGRAPHERTIFCNWGTSWWKIRDILEENMREMDSYQGKMFDYLEPKIKL